MSSTYIDKINIRIKLRSFDSTILDKFLKELVLKILEMDSSVEIIGPVAIPRKIENFSPQKPANLEKKDRNLSFIGNHSRHDRIIILCGAEKSMVEKLYNIDLPSSIGFEIQLEVK